MLVKFRSTVAGIWIIAVLSSCAPGQEDTLEASPSPASAVSLDATLEVLKDHEWVETFAILLRGKEKKWQQYRCYIERSNGTLQREPITSTEAENRRKAIQVTKAEAETLQVVLSMLNLFAQAFQLEELRSVMDSTERETREGTFTLQNYPREGDEVVVEMAGLSSTIELYEGEGDARYRSVTVRQQYASIDDIGVVHIRFEMEMHRQAATMIQYSTGFKKREAK